MQQHFDAMLMFVKESKAATVWADKLLGEGGIFASRAGFSTGFAFSMSNLGTGGSGAGSTTCICGSGGGSLAGTGMSIFSGSGTGGAWAAMFVTSATVTRSTGTTLLSSEESKLRESEMNMAANSRP